MMRKKSISMDIATAVFACAFSTVAGANQISLSLNSQQLSANRGATAKHGPSLPPDPWVGGLTAHGPSLPPDPWVGGLTAKHGPSLPPDPWVGGVTAKHGPSLPPDPWVGGLTA